MIDDVPTFLGSVMKAIACTPNKNFDEQSYAQGVVEPARHIRRLMEELGDSQPGEQQAREVIDLLLKIFETKQVDIEEREERIREILARNKLEGMFPDLLPLDQAQASNA